MPRVTGRGQMTFQSFLTLGVVLGDSPGFFSESHLPHQLNQAKNSSQDLREEGIKTSARLKVLNSLVATTT